MSQVLIDKLAYGGSGFGRIDGKACFVPFTTAGDLVEVRIEKSKKSYSEGVVEKIIYPSSRRTSPPCPVFGVCGGCNWQHILYDEQCEQKKNIFTDTLWRTARVEAEKIKPVLKAISTFEYRQRIQLKVEYSANKLSLGFYRRASYHVVDINDHCEIAAKPVNNAIRKVREIILASKQPANIPKVDIASASDASVSALFHYNGSRPEAFAEYLSRCDISGDELHSIIMHDGDKKNFQHIIGLHKLKYSVPSSLPGRDINLYFSPDSFSQINIAQNRVIVQLLLDYCLRISPDSILDLYCGNGNFSLPLAGMVKRILGFESSRKSVSLAKYNTTVNEVENARYICKDSLAGVQEFDKTEGKFDLVIMDPPRTGADQLCREVHKTGASHLIYISCDPPTLGRDLAILNSTGFEVIYIQPVDMFPQTYHLENVVFLKVV
jgi:23S rRNA (uracil1939-C5)-methyltransferase